MYARVLTISITIMNIWVYIYICICIYIFIISTCISVDISICISISISASLSLSLAISVSTYLSVYIHGHAHAFRFMLCISVEHDLGTNAPHSMVFIVAWCLRSCSGSWSRGFFVSHPLHAPPPCKRRGQLSLSTEGIALCILRFFLVSLRLRLCLTASPLCRARLG